MPEIQEHTESRMEEETVVYRYSEIPKEYEQEASRQGKNYLYLFVYVLRGEHWPFGSICIQIKPVAIFVLDTGGNMSYNFVISGETAQNKMTVTG